MSGYKTGGLEERFVVTRTDGKPIDPSRRYLVLDFSGADPHAIRALEAYADSVKYDNPEFAANIREALSNPENSIKQHQ